MLWQVITAANIAISIAYFGISWILFSGLRATKQLGSNKLATATALVFLTCAVHFGSHAALGPRDGWHWPTAAWDIVAAAVAFYFLSLRGSYASVFRSAQVFEDFKVRERHAREINDNIVQGLAVARLALESGDDTESRIAIEDTLRKSQMLISQLLGEDGAALVPGDLRRSAPAGVSTGGAAP